jgi:hypothetical protein
MVAAFVWPAAAARELVCVGRVLEVLGFAEEVELALLLLDDIDVELEDVEVELGITERFRNCEILLAWASLTVAWQGVGDGVVEAVTGQVCKPFETE